MIVEIVRSKPSCWYYGKEGTRFTVEAHKTGAYYKLVTSDPTDPERIIGIEDARIISESGHRSELTLIAPGSLGKVGEISILVTQVHIESRQVEYTISWWCEGRRYTERVPEYEITEAEKTMKVGFK